MSLSRTSLCDRAWLKNQSGPAAQIPLARYDAMVNQAMAIMAQAIASDPSERVRNQLKKDFLITVSSGVGSLTTALTASEPMLEQAINQATVTSADSSFPWQYIPTYEVLSLSRPTYGLIYFSIKNGSLVPTDTDGVLGSLSTTATVSANYVPLPATLSGNLDLEEQGIATLAKLVSGMESQVAA